MIDFDLQRFAEGVDEATDPTPANNDDNQGNGDNK